MVKNKVLVFVLITLFMGYFILDYTKVREKDSLFETKIHASTKLDELFKAVKNKRVEVDGFIDTEIDVNNTGMIGQRFTDITTTLGSLEAKRTSTNPNMAAMIVQLLTEAGIQKGDRVAVNVSGSFPALNLAVIAASEIMDVEPVIIASIGASTYGANNTLLTYLDMEKMLFQKGLIKSRSVAFSNGGADDIGSDINQEVLEEVKKRHSELEFIYIKNYSENVQHRMDLYNRDGEIDLFINVGGNIVSGGGSDIGFEFDNGLVSPNIKLSYNNKGLIGRFLSDGINVINLLNIKSLATEYGLKIDPIPIPEFGSEGIYYSYQYNYYLIYILLVIGGGGTIYYGYLHRKEIRNYIDDIKK